MYYTPILLIVIANIFYHIFQKSIPNNFNPILSLIITYSTALMFCIPLFIIFYDNSNLISDFKKLNWFSFLLGISIVLIELGFLLAYRNGWNVSLCTMSSNILVALLLIPIGIRIFKENISFVNLIGINICILGLFLINYKK